MYGQLESRFDDLNGFGFGANIAGDNDGFGNRLFSHYGDDLFLIQIH